MPIITRKQAQSNHDTLLRLAAGPTRLHQGTRKARHTATDAAVYDALVSHHHWASGRCYPGVRALAKRAGVGVATVSACIHRLRAAGYIRIRRHPIRVPGHGLRWAYSYTLIPVPRSELVAKPDQLKKEKKAGWLDRASAGPFSSPQAPIRSVEEQLALLARYAEREREAARSGF